MTSRIWRLTLIPVLLVALAAGCSKSPPPSAPPPPVNLKDLGVVEFVENTPQHFSLGDGKGCTITGKQIHGAIAVEIVVEGTNADGTVSVLSRPRIRTTPGQPCVFAVGEVAVELTPQWKTP